MINLLIAMNVILIALVIILLAVKNTKQKNVMSSLEDIELIEFQQNLKDLINELHKLAETKIQEMDKKKNETEEIVAAAETKIKEMKYLIDRNQLIRKSEYKAAISAGAIPDTPLFADTAKKAADETARKAKPAPAKFVMNEMPEENRKKSNAAAAAGSGRGMDKYDYINNLARNGMSTEEISKVTGMPRGEIELIKSIKK